MRWTALFTIRTTDPILRTIFRNMKNWIHIKLTLQRTTENSLSRAKFELSSSGFQTRLRQRISRYSLQCQINMNRFRLILDSFAPNNCACCQL